jgi:hypothetical protein
MQNNPFQNRITKTKKLGKDAIMQVSINEVNKRIFVDFSSNDGRLKVQKSFQDSFEGKKQAKEFEKAFKSLNDLKRYFGLTDEKA